MLELKLVRRCTSEGEHQKVNALNWPAQATTFQPNTKLAYRESESSNNLLDYRFLNFIRGFFSSEHNPLVLLSEKEFITCVVGLYKLLTSTAKVI